MKATAHFDTSEFDCKDGTVVPDKCMGNVFALCMALEQLRLVVEAPVTIISGYRSREYNRKCGGAEKSQHLTGKASDIRVSGKEPEEVASILEDLIKSGTIPQGGIGTYPTQNFVHYDIRGNRARWKG